LEYQQQLSLSMKESNQKVLAQNAQNPKALIQAEKSWVEKFTFDKETFRKR
jgi:hypothetical protein